MRPVTIYGDSTCPYCGAARMLLKKKGVTIHDVLVGSECDKRAEMQERSGRSSVPQIFVGDRHVGGFDELYELDRSGRLDELLAG